jgi:hypothetical protein
VCWEGDPGYARGATEESESEPVFKRMSIIKSEVRRPEGFNAISQPLQYCDKSPTQEAEPYDHHQYDQCGKEEDRHFPAGLRRRQSGLD